MFKLVCSVWPYPVLYVFKDNDFRFNFNYQMPTPRRAEPILAKRVESTTTGPVAGGFVIYGFVSSGTFSICRQTAEGTGQGNYHHRVT